MKNTIKIQLVKSVIGVCKKHRRTIQGLGLRRLYSISELINTLSVKGMIRKVSYLLKIIS